jgi:WD repeat-containing protein 24
MQDPHQRTNPVVASLAKISQHPYSSIALSPDGKYAIVAAKDSLRVLSVGPSGLTEVRNVRVSQRFVHTSVTAPAPNTRYDNLRDTFNLNKMAGPPLESNSNADVTDVAWSNAQPDGTEFIAAAGSNGVVVVWNAHDFVTAANSNGGPPPAEAVLCQHSRAVNRLAWHPSADRAGWLLTASQDSSAKCWERRAESTRAKQPDAGPRSWFGGPSQEKTVTHNYSWHCRPMFQLNSEHVRDIRWSPFHHDFFAAVTDNGTLHVYNVHLPGNYWAKIAAHTGEATTVDWHPTLTYVIATGGVDRTVKSKSTEKQSFPLVRSFLMLFR